MCLSLPARVLSVDPDDGAAVVDVRGTPRRVALLVLGADGDRVTAGDWLMVHTGYAVARIDPAEATDLVRLLEQAEGASDVH